MNYLVLTVKSRGSELMRDDWVPKGLGVTTEVRRVVSNLWLLLGREVETRDTPGGLVSIELSCVRCLYRELEEGTSTSGFGCDNGRVESDSFSTEVEEDVMLLLASVKTVLVYSETGLLRKGAPGGDWDLRTELRPAEV